MIREAILSAIDEANIWKEKYGTGSEIYIKPNLQKNIKFLSDYKGGDTFIKWVEEDTKHIYEIGGTKDISSIFLKDVSGRVIRLNGSRTVMNSLFNHNSEKGKGNTSFLTDLKEKISLFIFLNGEVSEEEVINVLSEKEKLFYKTLYYTSAVTQLRALIKFGINPTSGYYGEPQRGVETIGCYELARKLTGLNKDNWNPGDVWLIKESFLGEFRGFIKNFNKEADDIQILNAFLANSMKEKNVLPISLKQVSGTEAKVETISSGIEINKNFRVTWIDINLKSYKNFIAWTESGFGARVGYKADNLNIYAEGKEVGSNYSLGAIGKQSLVSKLKSFGADIDIDKKKNDREFEKLLKSCFNKYNFNMAKKPVNFEYALESYNELGDEDKAKAFNLVKYLHGFLIAPLKDHGQEKFFEWLYRYSKNLTNTSSDYIIIR